MFLLPIGEVVCEYLNKIEMVYNNVILDEYVIMPNHIHILLKIEQDESISISRIIKQFKGIVVKKIGFPVWQARFYDHIIRNEKEYYFIKNYIKSNPQNWYLDRYFM